MRDHMLFCKTVVYPDDFSVLAKSSCNFKLEIQESILIKLLKPKTSSQYSYIYFDIRKDSIHYLKNRRSNLIRFDLFHSKVNEKVI